jgi:hypothetical protein
MRRLLLCLSLCFALSPEPLPRDEQAATSRSDTSALRDVPDDDRPLPDAAAMERLARTDPIAFLENCLRRYNREVQGYRVALEKQERLNGVLQPREVLEADFREQPFSVLLKWDKGKGPAERVLYVRGENGDKMLVLPAGLARLVGIVRRDPNGPEARKAGRYPITEFGIKIGTERTLASWVKARREDALHVAYLGAQRPKEAGNRLCYVLRRTRYKRPEEGGVTEATIYIDKETWLQVGSVLKGAEGELIGAYYFRDIQLNPDFRPGTFSAAVLK